MTPKQWQTYLVRLAMEAHYATAQAHCGSPRSDQYRNVMVQNLHERMAQAAQTIVLELASERLSLPTVEQELEMVAHELELRAAERPLGQSTDEAEATRAYPACAYCHDDGWVPGGPASEDGTAPCPHCRPAKPAGGYRG